MSSIRLKYPKSFHKSKWLGRETNQKKTMRMCVNQFRRKNKYGYECFLTNDWLYIIGTALRMSPDHRHCFRFVICCLLRCGPMDGFVDCLLEWTVVISSDATKVECVCAVRWKSTNWINPKTPCNDHCIAIEMTDFKIHIMPISMIFLVIP